MIEINGRNICENCFEETSSPVCGCCGYDSENNANDPSMLAPGSILLGKYIIGSVIGKGGFGITYLAYDTKTNKKVAVKEYFPYGIAARSAGSPAVSVSSKDNEEAFELGAEKFYEEAQFVSKFNGNPNIVDVYEFFYENDTVYLAMEYLQGRTLKEYIRDHGIISAPQALFIANGVSCALAAAHSASVLHRDISPDNIILCGSGNVKLIDFGAARQVVAEHSQTFSVILKPGFAPIEQYNKKGNQGPWTDIYSLGATLYFALTGDIPEDPMVRFDNDDTFRENQFGIEPELWAVILKATDMRAEKRYKDAHEMQEDLNKIGLKPEPIVISADTPAKSRTDRNVITQNYKQHIDFSAEKNNKSFLSRHKSVIIAVCALAAVSAAVIIPISLNRDDDITDAYAPETSSISDTSEASETTSSRITDSDEASASGKFVSEYISPTIYDYRSKVYYNTLNDDEKELYDVLYSGIENADFKIAVPQYKYTVSETQTIYNKLKYDNPQIGYVGNYSSEHFLDSNNAGDLERYTLYVSPAYNDVNSSEMERFLIKDVLGLCEFDGELIKNISKVHDITTLYAEIMERSTDDYFKAVDSSYGFIVNCQASDIGFANGFCYCAQALGASCYVVEGTVNGEPRAWCRVKLDETWYNVDIYADRLMETSVTELEVNSGKRRRFRTFFLVNDDYIRKYGYVPDEEYEFLFDGEYAANSPESNYYLQQDGQNAFYTDPDAAYDFLLEEAAKNYSEGTEKTSCYVMPLEADGLYKKLNEQYLSDLEEKYGITPSEFTITYYPDEFVIAMT